LQQHQIADLAAVVVDLMLLLEFFVVLRSALGFISRFDLGMSLPHPQSSDQNVPLRRDWRRLHSEQSRRFHPVKWKQIQV
jgi:hypothetical protein